MKAKPIVLTSRSGNRCAFRSRLEARWSLYFDKLGFDWKYEPFKFDIGNKITYTPDFEVDGIGIIEVKPTNSLFLSESKWRIARYLKKSGNRVILLCGSWPATSSVTVLHGDPLQELVPDGMMSTLLLAGKQRWEAAKTDFEGVEISVSSALQSVSRCRLQNEAMTPSEIVRLEDTRKQNLNETPV